MRAALVLLPLALPALLLAQATPKPAPATPGMTAVRPTQTAVREGPLTSVDRWDRGYFAWDAGRYPDALEDFKRILTAPDAAEYHERIAELTGERWRTTEMVKDARAPRWSPDGRHLAYETGTGATRRLRIVRTEAGFPSVIDVAGAAPTFSPDGRAAAWLTTGTDGRVSIAWARLDGTPAETIPLDATAATGLTLLGTAPLRVAVISGTAGDSTSTVRARELTGGDGTWRTVPLGRGQPVDIVRSANGETAYVLIGARGAFARAIPGFTTTARTNGFALLDPTSTFPATVFEGTNLAISADGRSIAYLVPAGTGTTIAAMRNGTVVNVHRSTTPIAALAVAPDGSRVAWQTMLREDWELFAAVVTADAAPMRVTREIQHDLAPQFLAPTRLLGLIGEARHRRAHLYDLTTGTRTRLFHNNSIRTVAPEYEWVASPDGTRVAIVSERDGDTVTPHRHLYLTDLVTPVSRAELVARVDSNLTAERALRAAGSRMFAPIALAVSDAAAAVDVGRIYSYERDLFAFDSKHITQPGNRRAVDWLLEKYRSFGLQAHLQPFRTLAGSEIDVANVVAVIPGTVNPELVYVVGAHFDSRAEGPGADDNTSGTAMILEAARVLAKRPQPATIMFVAFTGEESGLRGAREFGRRMKDSITVLGALNNDMMGWANDHRMDNTIRYSNPGLRDVQHAAAIQFSRLITYDAFYYKNTDANALYDAWGDIIGGIGSYPILGNPHYHMPHDVLETINHQQLAETSRTTVATIMLMASSPSRLTGVKAIGTSVTWDVAREKGPMRYRVQWGPANDPAKFTATVTSNRATLAGALPGWKVAVKAVNGRGLEGWDWARGEVQ